MTGKELTARKYDYIESFPMEDNLARVWIIDPDSGVNYGYIDRTGKEVIPLSSEYRIMIHFSEGMAMVSDGDKWGYIDTTGELVVPLKYDSAGIFQGGMAWVELDGKWGFIDIPVKKEKIATLKIGSPEYILYGETVRLIVTTTIVDNRTLVSADFITTLLYKTTVVQEAIEDGIVNKDFLVYDDEANTVTITWNDKCLVLTLGELQGGMDVPAQLLPVDDLPDIRHVVLPLRFVCETLGFSVEWDGVNGAVYVYY